MVQFLAVIIISLGGFLGVFQLIRLKYIEGTLILIFYGSLGCVLLGLNSEVTYLIQTVPITLVLSAIGLFLKNLIDYQRSKRKGI